LVYFCLLFNTECEELLSALPSPQAGVPPLVGCSRLFIQCICSDPPYLVTASSIHNLRTRRALSIPSFTVTLRPLLHRSDLRLLCSKLSPVPWVTPARKSGTAVVIASKFKGARSWLAQDIQMTRPQPARDENASSFLSTEPTPHPRNPSSRKEKRLKPSHPRIQLISCFCFSPEQVTPQNQAFLMSEPQSWAPCSVVNKMKVPARTSPTASSWILRNP
jgi:hypothetical protein